MRDIKRIDRICDKIKELGKHFPDERLGQFFMNHIFNDGKDPFYREDERNEGVPADGQTGEEKIGEEIKRCNLYRRVLNETSYTKEHDKGFEKLMRTKRYNRLKFGEKEPKGEDYVKELK